MSVGSPTLEYSRRARLYWLGDGSTRKPELVGDEVACLSALPSSISIPPAFCMTALSPNDLLPDELDEVWELLTDAYLRMRAVSEQPDPRLVVRRSSYGFLPAPPPPPTFLNLVGLEGVAAAIHEVLAWPAPTRPVNPSLPAAALGGRGRSAVLVQLFVPAEVTARVAPTRDGGVAIRATWGLGEGLADEFTPADTWRFDQDLRLVRRTTATKERMTVLSDGGVVNVFVPMRLRKVVCLNDDEVRRIAATYLRAGGHVRHQFGLTVAVADGRSYVVSCAPLP